MYVIEGFVLVLCTIDITARVGEYMYVIEGFVLVYVQSIKARVGEYMYVIEGFVLVFMYNR